MASRASRILVAVYCWTSLAAPIGLLAAVPVSWVWAAVVVPVCLPGFFIVMGEQVFALRHSRLFAGSRRPFPPGPALATMRGLSMFTRWPARGKWWLLSGWWLEVPVRLQVFAEGLGITVFWSAKCLIPWDEITEVRISTVRFFGTRVLFEHCSPELPYAVGWFARRRKRAERFLAEAQRASGRQPRNE